MKIIIYDIDDLKKKGVYCIKNIITNKLYIGSTITSFKKRLKDHKIMMKHKNHHNVYLNRAVIKYGIENFEFSIIEFIPNNDIIREREKYYIDILKTLSTENGYNISNETTCIPHNEETRRKISNSLKLKYQNDIEFKQRMEKITDKKIGVPSWNKGLKCDNISNARKEMFDDIEVYDLNMNFFRKFDNPLEIERFSLSKENDLPIPEYTEYKLPNNHFSRKLFYKNKIIRRDKIYKALKENKFYKGLFFKKIKRNNNGKLHNN